MPDNHYEIGQGTERSQNLRRSLGASLRGWYDLQQAFNAMTQMLTGPSSDPASFANVVQFFDIGGADQAEKQADAKGLYDELNSTLGNSPALLQLLARTG